MPHGRVSKTHDGESDGKSEDRVRREAKRGPDVPTSPLGEFLLYRSIRREYESLVGQVTVHVRLQFEGSLVSIGRVRGEQFRDNRFFRGADGRVLLPYGSGALPTVLDVPR